LLVEALNGLTRFKECAQQLVRLNDIAFTIVFMGINDRRRHGHEQRGTSDGCVR
jgi:hypothetical protein